MANYNPNSTNYEHSFEPNTTQLTMAMDYNSFGQPIVRTVSSGSTSLDAFGRQQVAQPFTLFDSSMVGEDNGKFDTSTAGGASTTYNVNESSLSMTVAGTENDQAIRQSYRTFPYQPGKALEILNTFSMATAATGLRQRVGYFTTNNGVYFEQDGDTIYMVLRSFVTGSIVETRVAQDSWNGDKLDGTGSSGIALDITKSNIFYIDMEWLGVGSVRTGFIINGTIFIAHTFHNANITSDTTYMTSAEQSIRYEITNTATTGTSATMKQICSTVISSGGYQGRSQNKFAGRGLSYYTLTPAFTFYNLVSIKLRTAGINKIVVPNGLNIISDSNQNVHYKLLLNATANTALSFSNASTFVESSTTSASITGGTQLGEGFITNKGEPVKLEGEDLFAYQLGRTISGTSDILTIAVAADSNNTDVGGGISWYEL